ncbi:retrovirus-related pol polyprotein from transposon TNT 1-94 [Tanacetum coccineum]
MSTQDGNLNDTKVKQLRSDNGTEFINHTLDVFCDEKGISQKFSSPCTPEQNGGEAINAACYTQNRSIIVKRHRKTAYEVFRGRAPDISYFHIFGCPVHIHNHRDHLGKFDEKADDGSFLGYSLVAKAFKVFNIRRQEIEETFCVTFNEDNEAISQTSTEGDAINFNEVRSFPDDEFLKPRNRHSLSSLTIEDSQIVSNEYDVPTMNEVDHSELADVLNSTDLQEDTRDRWLREKHIDLVNIIGEPLAGITTRSRVRDSEAALAHECLYVNFLSEIEPKKLIEALE